LVAGKEIESLARQVVDQGYRLHRDIGPGLLESVYETVLADRLRDLGCHVETQKSVDINIDGKTFQGAFRADLIINQTLLVELKSVERLTSVHIKQTLTYIRLLNFPIGLLMNFGGATYKEGIRRVMNDTITK
jgi:iron complex transport system substrate-binding protein